MSNQICEDVCTFVGVLAKHMGLTPNEFGMIPNLSLPINPEKLEAAIAAFEKSVRQESKIRESLAMEFFRGERRTLFQGYGYQIGRILDGWAAAMSRHADHGLSRQHDEAVAFLLGAIEQTHRLNKVGGSDDDLPQSA